MKYRNLGKSDLRVFSIGLGTGQFGSRAWGYNIRFGDEDIIKIIRHSANLGINLFDTSETYGYGKSEMLLGEALRQFDRDDLIIVSKVAPWNLTNKRLPKAVERSLKRLNIDVIDLFLVHYPNFLVPIKETFRTMEKLIKRGKLRYIGVSNFSQHLLRKAQENLSFSEIVTNEVEYNILSRKAEKEIIPFCYKQNISIIAYSPLAGGVLSGKYSYCQPPKDKARAFNFLAKAKFLKRAQPLFEALREIAEAKKASIAQIALSWILRLPTCVAIPAALTCEQVEENVQASNLRLSSKHIEMINDATVSLGRMTYIFDNHIIRPISWTKETLKRIWVKDDIDLNSKG